MTPSDNPRERLLEAAGEIFSQKGFKGATVREIIDRAGVNIAAVNYYFRDKERLYIEAVKHGACVEADEQLSWPADTSPADKLADFIRFHVVRLLAPDKPAWHARLMMRELTQPSEACLDLVRDYMQPKSRILGGILEELLPLGTPRRQQFLTAFSIMGQILFYGTHKSIVLLLLGDEDQPYEDTAALADHITHFTLRALGLTERRSAARSRGVAP
jgi:AcrR family transcriptional regulator